MMRSKSSVMLIIMQIALTLAIVSNAAYIIHQRIHDMQRDTGIPEQQVIGFSMYFFDNQVDIIKQLQLDAQKLKTLPGVLEASAINSLPLSDGGSAWGVRNQLATDGVKNITTGAFVGDTDLVSSLGQTVSRGRNFTAEDMIYLVKGNEVPKVAIVTQALANALFPAQDALGKTFYSLDMPLQIVGIVDHMQGPWVHSSIVERNIFVPALSPGKFVNFAILAEKDQVNSVLANAQEFLLGLESRRVVSQPETVAKMKANSYQSDRLMTNMLFVIIVVLIFITALGIAGMTIFNVNRRQKQIGTRRALGASKANIIQYFITESAIISAVGIALGIILALVLNHYLMSYFKSTPLAIGYIIATILGIVVVINFSVYWPARKASLISPAIATRSV